MRFNIKLIILTVIVLALMTNIVCPMSFAASDDVTQLVNNVTNKDVNVDPGMQTKVNNLGKLIFNAVRNIGIMLGVVLIVFFGVRWLLANPQQKAQLKEQAWNYAIGAGFLIGAIPIAEFIYNIVTNNIK